MKKVKVTVSIADQLITLCGTEDEGYIEGVAAYVDTKMRELQRTNPALSTSACVMLAAVNITDELFKLRQQYAELDQRISELAPEVEGAVGGHLRAHAADQAPAHPRGKGPCEASL